MLGPRGEIFPLPLSALEGAPFENFAPGLILCWHSDSDRLPRPQLAWRRHPHATLATRPTHRFSRSTNSSEP